MKIPTYKTTTWVQHSDLIIQNTEGKPYNDQLLRIVYAKFVHKIWMKKNQRTFEDKHKWLIVILKYIA